jgi:hypothetical protein
MNIAPAQVQVARQLLGWSQSGLALKAGRGRPIGRTVSAIRHALEAGGIEFTEVSVTFRKEKAGP